jgi:hypothetical protein
MDNLAEVYTVVASIPFVGSQLPPVAAIRAGLSAVRNVADSMRNFTVTWSARGGQLAGRTLATVANALAAVHGPILAIKKALLGLPVKVDALVAILSQLTQRATSAAGGLLATYHTPCCMRQLIVQRAL